jgi:hypothetical protein
MLVFLLLEHIIFICKAETDTIIHYLIRKDNAVDFDLTNSENLSTTPFGYFRTQK